MTLQSTIRTLFLNSSDQIAYVQKEVFDLRVSLSGFMAKAMPGGSSKSE